MVRIARKRIIFQHWFIPANKHGLYKKAQDTFYLSNIYVWQPKTYFGRVQVISIFDRIDEVVEQKPAMSEAEIRSIFESFDPSVIGQRDQYGNYRNDNVHNLWIGFKNWVMGGCKDARRS